MEEITMNLLEGPELVLEHILSYLSYDEIAKMRLVCKAFNEAGQRLLNRGFIAMQKKNSAFLKSVKARLPRRESERRHHPMAGYCDILTSIETRISMLAMTYSKYIDQNICCFIPGKVIDEILRILQVLEECDRPPRAHEILQELRDISSMAIEHFDEKISVGLKLKQRGCPLANVIAKTNLGINSDRPVGLSCQQNISQGTLRQAFNKVVLNKVINDMLTKKFVALSNEFKSTKELVTLQRKQIIVQRRKILKQDAQISKLQRRMDDWEAKHNEITANVSQISNYKPASTLRAKVIPNVFENVAPVLSQMLDSVVTQNNSTTIKKSIIQPRKAQITLKRTGDESDKDDSKKIKINN